MNRVDALDGLFAKRASERLIAARALHQLAKPEDLELITRALEWEQTTWVKAALEAVCARLSGAQLVTREPGSRPAHAEDRDLIDRTKHETIGQIIHELTPAVGRVKMAVMREVAKYEGSGSEAALQKLTRLIDMFSRWRRVNEPLELTRVNVHNLLLDVVDDETQSGVPIEVVFNSAVSSVQTDAELLRVAVANGLRNAVQAVLAKSNTRTGEEQVCVTYGLTDKDCWISIIDDGVGLRFPADRVIQATATTKPGHSGMGLPVAVEAIQKLDGRVSLRPMERGGTQFLVEVPLGNALEDSLR